MRRHRTIVRYLLAGLIAVAAGILGPLASAAPALSGPEPEPTVAPASRDALSCLDCHGDPNLSMALPGGAKLSLFVDEAEMSKSVHQGKLGCNDCHSRITGVPHKKLQAGSLREYAIVQYEACKRCHFANYTMTLDSVHYQVLESGNQKAPLCTDCHGYHNVSKPDQPRSKISLSCAKCHQDTYQAYTQSVHGAALLKEENPDVPVCTDCHGTHTIKDSGTASFRLDSPEMCGKCHADETLMRRYNLSPNVFKTYLQDFHGATVTLAKRQGSDSWAGAAVCSDCHGVHTIKSTRGSDPVEIKQNVVATCQRCHPDAGTNFPDAWLSHYDLSAEKAALPYLVRTGYTIAIPFMVCGLMLHILVDLWRVARNR